MNIIRNLFFGVILIAIQGCKSSKIAGDYYLENPDEKIQGALLELNKDQTFIYSTLENDKGWEHVGVIEGTWVMENNQIILDSNYEPKQMTRKYGKNINYEYLKTVNESCEFLDVAVRVTKNRLLKIVLEKLTISENDKEYVLKRKVN